MDIKPWYKKWWGMILAILVWPLFLSWYVWTKTKWPMILKIGATIAIVLVVAAFSNRSTSVTETASTEHKIPALSEKNIPFEIINDSTQGVSRTLDVYTAANGQDLIDLNDQLLSRYRAGNNNLFVHYFDDRAVAKSYFQKQADPSISDSVKDGLYMHFVADMKYNAASGYKKLVKQGAEQVVLKEY